MREGKKDDQDKLRYDLFPPDVLEDIVNVLTEGAKKYEAENWKLVPNANRRYYSALMRHVEAWRQGYTLDTDDNLPHLAHGICCLVFLHWLDKHHQPTETMNKI